MSVQPINHAFTWDTEDEEDANTSPRRTRTRSRSGSNRSVSSVLLDELKALREENCQLKHEKQRWQGTRGEIERDLSIADAEAQVATQRVAALETELRRQSNQIETSHLTQDELAAELEAVQQQLAETRRLAQSPRGHSAPPPPLYWTAAGPAVNPIGLAGADGECESDSGHPDELDDEAAAAGGASTSPSSPAAPSPNAAVADENTAAARELLVAELEEAMARYEEELREQRQAYQDELDEREAEIERLQHALVQSHEGDSPATAKAGAAADDLDESLAVALEEALISPGPDDGPHSDSTDDDDIFYDAEDVQSESEIILECLLRYGAATVDALLVRVRAADSSIDWSSATLRTVLHTMEASGDLLLRIDESGDDPVLLFHAAAAVGTPKS